MTNIRFFRHFASAFVGVFIGMTQAAEPVKEYPEARDLFKAMIEHNTTLKHGTQGIVADIKQRLLKAGFSEDDIFVGGVNEQHQNIVFRLKGRSDKPGILWLAHLDVVEADPQDWTLPPFVFTEDENYFYGRGTTDIKNGVSNLIFNLMRLKRENFRPRRDIIVALTDAEEVGDEFNGVHWLLKNHPDRIKSEFVMNLDGGSGELKDGIRRALDVQTSEKLYRVFDVTATDKGGHSSVPTKENAIHRLAKGLARLDAYQFPVRVSETMRAYFQQVQKFSDAVDAERIKALLVDESSVTAQNALTQNVYYNALLRTTCVPTIIEGGHSENALPQRAKVTLQCRLLPDEDIAFVKAEIVRVLADSSLQVQQIGHSRPSPSSPLRNDVFDAIRKTAKQFWPDAAVIPVMTTGASDGVYLRAAGVPVYGVNASFEDVDDVRAHGQNERLLKQSFYQELDYTLALMKRTSH